MYPVLLLIMAFSSRGNLAPDKLTRLKTDLKDTMGQVIEMMKNEDLQQTYANFADYIQDGDAAAIMTRWSGYFAGNALIRIRVTIQQAQCAGLTSLDTINRAVHLHPHFPWYLLVRLYPMEWAAANAATVAVGNNAYYGFRQDLGPVKATKYKRLAWACSLILIATGETNLGKYKGFVADKSQLKNINDMIEAYTESLKSADMTSDATAAEMGAVAEYVHMVVQYPANML